MGYFATWLYRDGEWSAGAEPDPGAGAWLHLDVHDSDITTIHYSPAGDGSGEAFLGYSPRAYFEDESASDPTDPDREARALAAWVAANVGGDPAELEGLIRPFLAGDEPAGELDPDAEPDDAELDDAEIFVEQKTLLLLEAVGLPEPTGYWD